MQQLATGHRAAAHRLASGCSRRPALTPSRRRTAGSGATCRAGGSGSRTLDTMFQPNSEMLFRNDKPRALVVGAGVAGLTTALRLLEGPEGWSTHITVMADKFSSDTTTHGAAGVWQPYKLSETPQDLVDEWGDETFVHLCGLVHSEDAVQAGVQMCYVHSLHTAPEPDPFWAGSVHGFRRLSEWELQLFSKHVDWTSIQKAAAATQAAAAEQAADEDSSSSRRSDRRSSSSYSRSEAVAAPTEFVDGFAFNTVVCEGRLYLRWLTERLRSGGVQFMQRKVSSLAELQEEGWDVIVNCSGLGASTLLPDGDAGRSYPIRGQVMRVRAPWVQQCVFAEWPDGTTTYVIPNRDSVVLGGTAQVGDSGREVRVDDSRAIADRAMQVVPSLKGAELLDQWVGLRPGRKSLRVELEPAGDEPRAPRIVHNYGHGGAGLTLAWGTAGAAAKLAAEVLEGVVRRRRREEEEDSPFTARDRAEEDSDSE